MATIADYPLPTRVTFPAQRSTWQVDPARAALLIHSMQDNLLPTHAAESETASAVIRNIQALCAWAAANNVPTLYSLQPPETDIACPFAAPLDATQPGRITQALAPNSNGTMLSKTRHSSFNNTELLSHLHSARRDQLLITGLDAYGGCLVAALEAFNHGLQSFFVADAVLANNAEEHQRALDYVASRCGQLLETNALAGNDTRQSSRDWLYERVLQLIDDEEQVDPNENLIFYGLDSLQVMKIAAELKERGITVTFDELARTPTLVNWWALIDSRQ